jgi:hypothetical protein
MVFIVNFRIWLFRLDLDAQRQAQTNALGCFHCEQSKECLATKDTLQKLTLSQQSPEANVASGLVCRGIE